MCAVWNEKKSNPGLLVAEINRTRRERSGKVTFEGLEVHWFQSALLSAVQFDSQIPDGISPPLVWAALSRVTQGGKLSANELIKAISEEERRYLRSPLQGLYVRISVSAEGEMPFRTARFHRICVSFGQVRQFDRTSLMESARNHLHGVVPREYQDVILSVSARSPQEAIDIALDDFDVLRGLWNLYVNSGQALNITISGRVKLVNRIRLGPLHTVHHQDGSLVTQEVWFDPSYARAGELYKIDAKMSADLRRNFMQPRRLLARSPLADDACEGIRRYCRALDSWDLNQAFTQLWSTLEYLTDTTVGSYDVTVRRAAARGKDYQLTSEILRHLQNRRNRLVHATQSQGDIEMLVHQLKWSIEDLLRLYVVNPAKLRSRQEVGEFLDAPRECERLDRRIHILSASRRLRSSPRPTS